MEIHRRLRKKHQLARGASTTTTIASYHKTGRTMDCPRSRSGAFVLRVSLGAQRNVFLRFFPVGAEKERRAERSQHTYTHVATHIDGRKRARAATR